jgi:hypothetical protein
MWVSHALLRRSLGTPGGALEAAAASSGTGSGLPGTTETFPPALPTVPCPFLLPSRSECDDGANIKPTAGGFGRIVGAPPALINRSPALGQGANSALMDVVALRDALRGAGGDLEKAVEVYSAAAVPEGRALVQVREQRKHSVPYTLLSRHIVGSGRLTAHYTAM